MHALCIAILVILWSASESKRTFPGQLRLDLVDKQGDYNLSDTMVTKAKQTLKHIVLKVQDVHGSRFYTKMVEMFNTPTRCLERSRPCWLR